jgi:MFS family permease
VTDNPPRKTAITWLIITAACFAFVFIPGIVGVDGMQGGYAISFVSFFLGIVGIVVVVIYAQLASILSRLLRGEGLLAHWIYTSEKWMDYAKKEYVEEKTEKKGLFIVVSGFALFFGFLFWALDPENGIFVFYVMLGLIAVCAFAWQFTAWNTCRQNKRATGEVYIGKDAVYLNRRFFTWRLFGSSLTSVTLENKRGLTMLIFTYSALTFPGPQIYNVRVPVPKNQEETAKNIAKQFKTEMLT